MSDSITAISYSRWAVISSCLLKAKLSFVDKEPQPERPDKPPGQEYPDQRGSRVHNELEACVRGCGELPKEARCFKSNIEHLAELYNSGLVEVEEMWCFDDSWAIVPWNAWDDIRMRIKVDVCVRYNNRAVVIDYKTGKRFGNEVTHMEQCQLYALGTFLRYPDIDIVDVELWYSDLNEIHSASYTRQQGMRFFELWQERVSFATTVTTFTPNPGVNTCRFCPYKTGPISKNGVSGTGACSLNP